MKTAAVVLAAGKSSRMGKNKLLLEFCGKKLIDHLLDVLIAAKIDEIIVVLGHKPWEIVDLLECRLHQIRTVINQTYEQGMTSSFQVGIKQVENADAALLILGDQLIPNHNLIDTMITQMHENKGKVLIVSPIFKGRRGHPVLFSKELFGEILSVKDETIRDLIHRHEKESMTINANEWTTKDIDYPRDFADAVHLIEDKKKLNKERKMN